MGVVLYVWDWIPVRVGPSVKGSIDSTGLPTGVLLRHEIVGGQRVLGAFIGAFPQHGVKLILGVGLAVWCRATYVSCYSWAGCVGM